MALDVNNAANQIAGLLPIGRNFVNQKASLANAVSGQDFSLWRATGDTQGAIPAAAADCDHATVGGIFPGLPQTTSPVENYLAYAVIGNGANNNQNQALHDRLRHMGGLNGTLTTAQTVGLAVNTTPANMVQRIGAADYSEVHWWLEWYTDTGATSVNVTVAVTYDDGSTGNIVLTAIGTTVRAGRMIRIMSAVTGRYIRSVDTVTLSATTGAAGSFGVTATRLLCDLPNDVTVRTNKFDWASLPITLVPRSCCPFTIATVSGTATGTIRFAGKVITA